MLMTSFNSLMKFHQIKEYCHYREPLFKCQMREEDTAFLPRDESKTKNIYRYLHLTYLNKL